MHIAQRLVAVLSVALLSGCGAADDEGKEREPPPVEETVFGDMVGTMDKARGVEETVLKQKQELDRKLEESEASQSQ